MVARPVRYGRRNNVKLFYTQVQIRHRCSTDPGPPYNSPMNRSPPGRAAIPRINAYMYFGVKAL